MSKTRVYELAKALGVESKALLLRIQKETPIEAPNHLHALNPDEVEAIKAMFARPVEGEVVTHRISSTVVRRRARRQPGEGGPEAPEAPPRAEAEAAVAAELLAAEPPPEEVGPVAPPAVETVAEEPAVVPESPPVFEPPAPPSEPEEPEAPPLPPVVEREAAEIVRLAPVEPEREPVAEVLEEPPAAPVEVVAEPSIAEAAVSVPEVASAPPPEVDVQAELVVEAPPLVETPTEPETAPFEDRPGEIEEPFIEPAPGDEAGDGQAGAGYRPKYADAEVTRRIRLDSARRAQVVDRPLIPIRTVDYSNEARGAGTGARSFAGRPGPVRPPDRFPGRPDRIGELPVLVPPPMPSAKPDADRREKRKTVGRRVYDRRRDQTQAAQEGLGKLDVFAPRRKKKGAKAAKVPLATPLTTPKAAKRTIKLDEGITVGDLAQQMSTKAGDVIKRLLSMGVMATINHVLDFDTATLIASEYGFTVENVTFEEDDIIRGVEDRDEDLFERPPVVTIMGHIDHGKTSLLDAIRKSNIVATEAGGITQRIGAFMVDTPQGRLTFVDTPGHNAFTAMRARGAQVSDLVILVVAADDGVMEETREAINHARAAEVPIVVAINKCDRPEANPERVRQQLVDVRLVPEEWGGDTLICDVSAKAKTGIERLLEAVMLQSEMLELRANPDKAAKGVVVEAKLDPHRGPVATVIIQEGTLHKRDYLVSGRSYGRVRAMVNDLGQELDEAPPSTPVEVTGLSEVPTAGDPFNVVQDDRQARTLVEHREEQERRRRVASVPSAGKSLEDLLGSMGEQETKTLNVVLKADSQGSVEAIRQALVKLSAKEVDVKLIHDAVGGITESDINLASASAAVIVGFNVRPEAKAKQLAEQEGVTITLHSIIYELTDWALARMRGLVPKLREERELGRAEVLQTFRVAKSGMVAGSTVRSGKLVRGCSARLVRDSKVVYEGRVVSLKRFKDDAKEVAQGYECGIVLENFADIKVGDVIEAYEFTEVEAALTPADAAAK